VAIHIRVECYAGYRADERPVRFSIETPRRGACTASPQTYEVKEILDQWYGVGYQCFKVLADDGNLYILRHDQTEDTWTLDSFRRDGEAASGKAES
jgi:hypothetical protein